jgi:hypothetical protein
MSIHALRILRSATPALIAFALLCSMANGATKKPEKAAAALPRVSIPNTEILGLKSSDTGRDYDLYVHLPDGYARGTEKKYPIVYVLDGQWDFKLLASIYGGLRYDQVAPELIVVGVTYSGDSPDYGALRAMDYTPTPVKTVPGSGDAPKFLAFFKKELIPFVEANYPADPSRRALLGSSYGGLFTLYAMFSDPELFRSYVAVSPDVLYDDRYGFKQEAAYARKRRHLPVSLYLAVGEKEDLRQPVEDFARIVSDRGYTGLKVTSRVVEGEGHSGVKPEAFNRGLRFVMGGESGQ